MSGPNSAASTYIGRCVVCGDDLFDPETPLGVRVKLDAGLRHRHVLERVDIGNHRPWAGVRLICAGCLAFFRGEGLTDEQ